MDRGRRCPALPLPILGRRPALWTPSAYQWPVGRRRRLLPGRRLRSCDRTLRQLGRSCQPGRAQLQHDPRNVWPREVKATFFTPRPGGAATSALLVRRIVAELGMKLPSHLPLGLLHASSPMESPRLHRPTTCPREAARHLKMPLGLGGTTGRSRRATSSPSRAHSLGCSTGAGGEHLPRLAYPPSAHRPRPLWLARGSALRVPSARLGLDIIEIPATTAEVRRTAAGSWRRRLLSGSAARLFTLGGPPGQHPRPASGSVLFPPVGDRTRSSRASPGPRCARGCGTIPSLMRWRASCASPYREFAWGRMDVLALREAAKAVTLAA